MVHCLPCLKFRYFGRLIIDFETYMFVSAERYSEALDLLESGAGLQLKHGQLLDEIAEKFYGVQRRNSLQGMFGDLFKVIIDILIKIISEYGKLLLNNLFAVVTSFPVHVF
ncbi:hypothetical protein V6N13_131173 [Hibiscus sabdariffa]